MKNDYPRDRASKQKLPDTVWSRVYETHMGGESLTAILFSDETLRAAHPTSSTFRKAFDNYCSRAKLSGIRDNDVE
jgi:hypothetical protein